MKLLQNHHSTSHYLIYDVLQIQHRVKHVPLVGAGVLTESKSELNYLTNQLRLLLRCHDGKGKALGLFVIVFIHA